MEILIDKIPFMTESGSPVQKIIVNPLNFKAFSKLASDTANRVPTKQFNVSMKRARMIAQSQLVLADNQKVKFDEISLSNLPIVYAKQLNNAIGEGQGEPGKVINEGDGISSSIIFQLGTPLKMKGSDGKKEIKELEFLASTFGQIEEAMAELNPVDQVIKLLETIAKPVDFDVSLQALPSSAVDQITMSDGFTMSEIIIPRFFD